MSRLVLPLCFLLVACDSNKARDGDSSPTAEKAEAPSSAAADGWTKLVAGGSLGEKVEAQVAVAKGERLLPVVYVGAGWCEPCLAIKKYKSDPRMKEAFAGVHIIEVDMDQWQAKDFAALNMKPTAIPVFYVVGDDGKATGKQIDGGAWGDNVPENMAPPLKAFFHAS